MRILNNNQLLKEIAIALVFITGYQLCLRIPLPYTDPESLIALPGQLGNPAFFNDIRAHFSILALGIMPYISAYVIVELCSLFVPFLKKHRQGDLRGRTILKAYALVLTLVLAALQSKFILNGISQMLSPGGGPILTITNIYQEIIFITVQVAGVFVLVLAAEIVSIYSIGNGISILILSGTCAAVYQNTGRFLTNSGNINANYFHLLLFSFIIFVSFILIPIILIRTASPFLIRHESADASVDFFKLNACPSGKLALSYGTSIVMLPAALFPFMVANQSVSSLFVPGSLSNIIITIIVVFILSYLFGWLFIHPKNRIQKLQGWGWHFPESAPESAQEMKKRFLLLNLPWTLFLCLLVILPTIVVSFFDAPFFLGGSSVVIIGVIGMDIFSRLAVWRAIGDRKLVKVAEFHDMYDAAMIRNHLAAEQIRFYLQGYFHRHLLYFMGPFISINLMVTQEDAARTALLINKYYKGLGLLGTISP